MTAHRQVVFFGYSCTFTHSAFLFELLEICRSNVPIKIISLLLYGYSISVNRLMLSEISVVIGKLYFSNFMHIYDHLQSTLKSRYSHLFIQEVFSNVVAA